MSGEASPGAWMAEPGFYHGPIDGSPHAGATSVNRAGPIVVLDLGFIAGREVSIAASLGWLDDLECALQVARARLVERLEETAVRHVGSVAV